jgi:gliding motility-associated-like protein
VVDNGSLFSSVGADKNTRDYVFDWYNGSKETPPSDFVGEIYSDLKVGTYSVTATSKITGCKSPLKSEVINKVQVFPDFSFFIQNPTCDQSNGFAQLILTSNVPVDRIEWENGNGPFQEGVNLSGVAAGIYKVTVTSTLGCATTKNIEIKPDVRPYNGISRNNDGQNEFFKIDCIQDFPNNIVKIFNRAGTLVYEARDYDNSTTYFDGRSNRGISLMGNQLPDGTYFYIVDKRDGSKPVAGYLEIVN